MPSSPATTRPASSAKRRHRLDAVAKQSIQYINAPEFQSLTERQLEQQAPEQIYRPELDEDDSNGSLPRLLTAEGERHLFRRFNFLKAKAHQLQKRAGRSPSPELNRQIQRLLQDAQSVRSQIVQANLRLVVALARKHARSQQDFEEFVSEGNLILVNAVDKFNFSRGFRFSTYATHSLQRHFFRLIQRHQRRKQREALSPIEVLKNVSSTREEAEFNQWNPEVVNEIIQRFDDCLNPRERAILEERFGLNGDSARTLKSVADKIGLSKERVRQLQIGAIEKLQDLAIRIKLSPETCL